MNKLYDDIDVQDIAAIYNESVAHYNSCYDFFCRFADKPVMIDIVEALAKHSAAIAKAEMELEQHGVPKDQIPLLVYKINERNNAKFKNA